MVSATGSAIRDQVLYTAIRNLKVEATFEAVAAALPKDFDLDEIEYGGAIKILALQAKDDPPEPPPQVERSAPRALMIDKNPDGHSLVPPKTASPGEIIEDELARGLRDPNTGRRQPIPDTSPEPVMTAIEANHAILKAQNRLGEARIRVQRARNAKMKAQSALADAITAWQNSQEPYTQEQLVRDHLRSEQEKRRQRIEGGIPPQVKTHGGSAIDIAAAYSKDNSPEGFARSRMQNGRSRGAFSKIAQHQINYDPRRGPVGKPPIKA
jgi:hypothetical protein